MGLIGFDRSQGLSVGENALGEDTENNRELVIWTGVQSPSTPLSVSDHWSDSKQIAWVGWISSNRQVSYKGNKKSYKTSSMLFAKEHNLGWLASKVGKKGSLTNLCELKT